MRTDPVCYLLFWLCLLGGCAQPKNVRLVDLQIEMRDEPDGIGCVNPRFSWRLKTDAADVYQEAYRIEVAASLSDLEQRGNLCWDSGRIDSEQSVLIPYTGKELQSGKAYFWRVSVWTNEEVLCESLPQKYSMGLLDRSEWLADWIGINDSVKLIEDETRLSARYLRKEFMIDRKIKRAMLYMCGLGSSFCYLNGQPVREGTIYHPPALFFKTLYYQTFDVGYLLQEGDNAIGVVLGNGRFQSLDSKTLRGVEVPRLLLQLNVEYEDGGMEQVVSDLTWTGTNNGPVIANNEYDGEEFDANLDLGPWTEHGYDDSGWRPVDPMSDPKGKLTALAMEDVCVMDEIRPVSLKAVAPEKYILDMGQNMVGWLHVKLKGKKNVPVTLRFAELLEEGDTTLFVKNLREAKATDLYIPAADGFFEWEPRFVFHGFRFVEITGIDYQPEVGDFTGKVAYDKMETIGSFETSDRMINQIYKNAYWSIRGNYRGMPVDCPQRDERQGWLGDRQATVLGESFIFHNALLYGKWLKDIEDSMSEKGQISVVSPRYWTIYSDDPAWSSTYFYVADMLYTQFGDERAIRMHYPSMKRWIEYMIKNQMKDYIIENDTFGDWCVPPESPELIHSKDPKRVTSGAVINTPVFYDLLHLMAKFSRISGVGADAASYMELATRVKEAYNKRYFDYQTAQYGNQTVTANALALRLGLVPNEYEMKVFDNIVFNIEKENNGHLSSGIVGLRYLMRTLTQYGALDLAYKLVTNDTYPSWGYMVKKGATTIWELWNGDTADPAMNSANHVMLLGDLVTWFYEDLAGIKNDPQAVGFKKVLMQPEFPVQLNYVRASYRSPYGLIRSAWVRDGDEIEWNITVPPNSSAMIKLRVPFEIRAKQGRISLKAERIHEQWGISVGAGSYLLRFHYPPFPVRIGV